MLNTKNANFSFGNGYKVFETAITAIEEQTAKAKDILILGFGCGSIHHLLEKKYNYSGNLVGVEYDPEIIRLYQHHFANAYNTKPILHIEDAADFLAKQIDTFDIIFIDLFCELENSPLINDIHFLHLLKNTCTSNATLVFNTTATDQKGTEAIFELHLWLSKHFKSVTKTAFQDYNNILIAQ